MDEYPAYSLEHNIPLLVTFGLSQSSNERPSLDPVLREEAVILHSELPAVEGDHAAAVLRSIESRDASGMAWNGRDTTRRHRFRIKTAGRTYMLPARRAALPESFETPQSTPALHSPFSPLSPTCHLYPDGVMEPLWLRKHQELVPSVFVCFYSLTPDPKLASLHDNKIKTDINTLRTTIMQSNYKSRLAIVILADPSAPPVHGAQERLDNIRRGCGLDPKAFFYLQSQGTQEDVELAADNLLATVYTHAIEYYRDLGRHSRKKRGRGFAPQPTVPPTSGTSQTLSVSGWNVRYDFKSAIFAEFRQEMDTALRSFEQAYETLLSPDVFDSIPSWSPRWNEARLLADTIAIRGLRCLLWTGQYSTAVRRWQMHRDRMADLIDRRGRGTNNYGWKAWEARWAIVMADVLERVKIPELEQGQGILFLQPEKSVVGERLPPWEHLHHVGYWYRSGARHIYSRRSLAQSVPEDDRRPPDSSPASKVAGRAFTYDNYMCPDPHEEYPIDGNGGTDHSLMIIRCLMAAKLEFEKRHQVRFAAEIALECAREFAAGRNWQSACELLLPLWNQVSIRSEGWDNLTEEIGWTLRTAASELGKGDLVVAIDWELLDGRYGRRQDWHYDISKALVGVSGDQVAVIKLSEDSKPSFLSASFVFKADEGKAGQTCEAQLVFSSNAFPGSAAVTFEEVHVHFEGSLKPFVLRHDPALVTSEGDTLGPAVSAIALRHESEDKDASTPLEGRANLTLQPRSRLVFEMAIPLREPGDAHASTIDLKVRHPGFTLEQTLSLTDTAGNFWFLSKSSKKRIARADPHSIHVLPRPPKLEIRVLDLLEQYYTNEPIIIDIDIVNAEDADADMRLDSVMFGEEPPGFRLLIKGEEIDTAAAAPEESALLSVPLGLLSSNKSLRATIELDPISLSAAYDFTVRASYRLVNDPATPIIQITTFQVNLVNPFEANYDLLPRLHADPWPSLFDYEAVVDYATEDGNALRPRGLAQAWTLVTRYASFASEDLKVTDLSITIKPTHDVRCHVTRRVALPEAGILIQPKTIEEAHFEIEAQKMSLDDRGPTSLDVSFNIEWQRLDGAAPSRNVTVLPVPRLGILGTEPRVLASVSYSKDPNALVVLDITVENASSHFLTFGLTMDPSDDFAFSGAKQITINLLPVSRRTATYRLLPLVRGAWVRPGLVVRDKYFQKVLRIIPTEGMKLDKEGFLLWVPPLDDVETE